MQECVPDRDTPSPAQRDTRDTLATPPAIAATALKRAMSCGIDWCRAPDGTLRPMKNTQPEPQAPLLLSRPEVERLTGLSTGSIYRTMRHSDFPEPLRIAKRAVRWRADEIRSWIDGRPRASGIVGDAA